MGGRLLHLRNRNCANIIPVVHTLLSRMQTWVTEEAQKQTKALSSKEKILTYIQGLNTSSPPAFSLTFPVNNSSTKKERSFSFLGIFTIRLDFL